MEEFEERHKQLLAEANRIEGLVRAELEKHNNIYVLSGQSKESTFLAMQFGVKRDQLRYVRDIHSLQGIRDRNVFVYGTQTRHRSETIYLIGRYMPHIEVIYLGEFATI